MKRIVQAILALLVLFVMYVWFTQPSAITAVISDLFGSTVSENIDPVTTLDEIMPTIQAQIELPTVEIPEVTIEGNSIRLTEADINGALGSFGNDQIQIAQVRLVEDQIIVGLSVAGLSTELTANLAAIDGQVVVQNPALSGVAGALIPINDLIGPFQATINQIVAQNAPVRAIRIENGAIVVDLNR
ncbi:MAG: hypothetical protein ACO3F2_01775 [Roseiflexaceae bacterium]|jgi:hypothetical protein